MKFFVLCVALFGIALQGESTPTFYIERDTTVLACSLKENKLYLPEKDRIYRLIEKQVHFLRGKLQPWKDDPSMKLITKSASGEHEIRPNTTFAADMGFLYRFGNYNLQVVGISRKEMLENELIPLLRYLVRTHKTGDLKTGNGKAWGDAWQSAHWASALGNAAWWVWDVLPADVQKGARNVVAHEADRIADSMPPHQVKLDSKSEENAWNSQVLSAALILMPGDARSAKWGTALQLWAFSAYLCAADARSTAIVDGVPVSRKFTGANIYDDFTLENHDIVHPDYMGAWIMNAGNDLDFLLTGRKPLQSFLYNLPQIYNNQKRLFLPDGGYCYPNGQDWALFRNPDWITAHATAVARFNDPGALYYLRAALATTEKMQQRNKDGAIYAPGENYFPSAQGHVGYWLVQAWLELQFAEKVLTPVSQKPGINYFAEGKIIIHRTEKAFHSVAWGAIPMIQLMPVATDHIVSPDQRNGIGRISVHDTIQPVVVRSVDIQQTKNSFVVHLVVDHGKYVKADILCESYPDGHVTISEKLTALEDCTTDFVETLSFGILNNPNWVYETGKRTLLLGQQRSVVKAVSGKSCQANTASVKVDGLNFQLDTPALVTYKATTKMEDSRYTDMLVLHAIPEAYQWAQGALISQNRVLISVR